MNYILAYWEAIERGEVVTSRRVRAVYKRLAHEIQEPDPDSPYYFDEEVGERPIIFAERFCKQSQGVIGAPLVLELFQKAYIQALFGFLEKENGFRRYRETTHLTWRERLKMETRLKDGWKPQAIADELGRHVSTIYREKKRGLGVQRTTDLVDHECYIPDIAQAAYEDTFSGKGPQIKIGHDHKLANYLGKVLKDGNRSPEAALGEIEAQDMGFDTKISTRTLYRYIDMGFIPGISNKDLLHKRNKKDKKKKEKPRAARSAKGKSIEERPKEVNDREEVGHWEMGTVLSPKDGSLERVLALTERATRYQINLKIKNGETATVVAALGTLERKLGATFSTVFQTITVDNGSEFADAEGLERSCLRSEEKRTTLYYCHPYSSSERGSNEKQNGMTRRRHPKGTDFKKVSKKKLRETTDWINNYPRKIFGFHTAAELFAAAFPGLPALY